MLSNRLTLMIHTCNKFSDLWDAHIFLLNKNWENRKIETLLITDEETDRYFEGIKVISAGKGTELSQRTEAALAMIKTEFVLITLDDYFPIYPINSNDIEKLLDIMDKENLDYIRMFRDPNSNKRMKGYSNLYRISLERNYEVNLYQGIWRKSFIEKTIGEPLNAWQYEVSLTKIARKIGANCALSKGKEFEILDVVRKGKILHKANRYLKKNNLYHGSRELISYTTELKLWIISTGKKILPRRLALIVKWIMSKCGYKFYSKSI